MKDRNLRRTQMIEILRETTEWEFPNGTYILNKGQLVGFQKKGESEFVKFRKPLNFNKKRRTFVKLKIRDISLKGVDLNQFDF